MTSRRYEGRDGQRRDERAWARDEEPEEWSMRSKRSVRLLTAEEIAAQVTQIAQMRAARQAANAAHRPPMITDPDEIERLLGA